eukprot:1145847-Pelagomonas_calceolata.AAC.5
MDPWPTNHSLLGQAFIPSAGCLLPQLNTHPSRHNRWPCTTQRLAQWRLGTTSGQAGKQAAASGHTTPALRNRGAPGGAMLRALHACWCFNTLI